MNASVVALALPLTGSRHDSGGCGVDQDFLRGRVLDHLHLEERRTVPAFQLGLDGPAACLLLGRVDGVREGHGRRLEPGQRGLVLPLVVPVKNLCEDGDEPSRVHPHDVPGGNIDVDAGRSLLRDRIDLVNVDALLAFDLGLPGALAYRALNTADTMLGYHDGPLEYFGKLAAKLDDLANLIPAPLAAVAIVAAAGNAARAAWWVMIRDHDRTASPNAGWTMSATAGALDLTLEKPGAYRLGHGRPPTASDIDQSIRLIATASVIFLAVVMLIRLII